jgi:hypothetical protein
MIDMRYLADVAQQGGRADPSIVTYPVGRMLKLNPYVIHDTPMIPAPGGMRSFFKISVSNQRYNLRGNSHNHLFDYEWEMVDREALRNQPVGRNRDYPIPVLDIYAEDQETESKRYAEAVERWHEHSDQRS